MSRTERVGIGMLESQVLSGVLEAFQLFGVEAKRRNVAGIYNPRGQYVACNEPGDSDVYGTFPATFGPAAGKSFACEVKKESFDAFKVRGKERERFERQVAKLRTLNDAGGYGWWATSPSQIAHALRRIREGWIILIDEDNMPYLERPS